MSALQIIEMFAGNGADGNPIAERIQVSVDEQNQCQLVKSPAFIKGLASGDKVKLNKESGQFEITEHSGNLCIRVYSKDNITPLSESITPEIEKLGGELDIETPRMLVYSIHVSCGFEAIEALFNLHIANAESEESAWMYGNVYDPVDGQTPLNWWLDILKPQ